MVELVKSTKSHKISIIIVTYNSLDLLPNCLDSILFYESKNTDLFEIIIVDNSPKNIQVETEKLVNNHKISKHIVVKYIPNSRNTGYGEGNNLGIKASNGEIIGIMNPDIRLTEAIYQNVISEFNNEKKLGILSFKQTGGSNLSFYFHPEYQLPLFSDVLIKILNKFNLFSSKFHYLSGALFFINKQKFSSVGGFDENIFLYFEEADVAKRIKNYMIKYIPQKKYLHLVGERTETSVKSWEFMLQSLTYYTKKYHLNEKRIFYFWSINLWVKYLIAKMFSKNHMANQFLNQYQMMIKNKDLFIK